MVKDLKQKLKFDFRLAHLFCCGFIPLFTLGTSCSHSSFFKKPFKSTNVNTDYVIVHLQCIVKKQEREKGHTGICPQTHSTVTQRHGQHPLLYSFLPSG